MSDDALHEIVARWKKETEKAAKESIERIARRMAQAQRFEIYTITAMTTPQGADPVGTQRVFGYHFSERDARYAVEQNVADMHECLYEWIVIEEVKPGVHGPARVVQWYEWSGGGETGRWVESLQPQWVVGIRNWSMG